MKTFPPHKNAGKKTLNTHSKAKSGAGSHNSGGHFNAKLHRHTQNHRLKTAKSIKPPFPVSAAGAVTASSSHKRDVPFTGVPSLANGGTTSEDSNGTMVEKEKEDARNEYDLFLQAFEKPTQIYRWLSVRHAVNPTFLNRTLTYMRGRDRPRRDAYAKRRKSFKLQDLYERSVEEEARKKIEMCGNNAYLNIQFTNFSEGVESHGAGRVTVSANLTKHSFVKRKDLSSPVQTIACGTVTLDVGKNESDGNHFPNTQVISLSCLNFVNDDNNDAQNVGESHQIGSSRHSYHLELIVEHVITREAPISHVTQRSANVDGETGESAPPAKKRRISGGPVGNAKTSKTLRYSTELIIYDKNHKLFLEDGDYEVVMLPSDNDGYPMAMVEQRTAVWNGCFDGNPIEPFDEICNRQPTLSFQLNWSKTPGCFREKDVIKPPQSNGPFFSSSSSTSSKMKVLDAIGVRTDTLTGSSEKISSHCALDDDGEEADNDDPIAKPRTRGVGAPAAPNLTSIPNSLYSKQKKPLRLFYNFSYRTQQQQQTEHKGNICPWCEVDCMNLYSLLKHLRLSHPRFTFFYVPQAKSARIDVSINASYDGSFEGNSQDSALTRLGFSFSRCRAIQRTPMTQILVYPGLRASVRPPFEGTLDEFIEASTNGDDVGHADNRSGFMFGHNRLYYRSTTVQPMTAADMDYDSETDTKPSWLKTKMCKLMDDFTDVNWGEKEVLKLWNIHVMEHDFTAYRHLPDLLQRFIRDKGRLMLDKQLENNYLQHLVNLHDFGLIKPSVVHQSFAALLRLKSDLARKNSAAAAPT